MIDQIKIETNHIKTIDKLMDCYESRLLIEFNGDNFNVVGHETRNFKLFEFTLIKHIEVVYETIKA